MVNLSHSVCKVIGHNRIEVNHLSEECREQLLVRFSLYHRGKLPVLKVGRKAIIRRDTLERFMSVNQGRNLLNENDVRKVE